MNIFLLGGWVARPSAFYFCACAGSLSYSVLLGRSAFRCRLACSQYSLFQLVACSPVPCLLIFTLLPVPVPSMPGVSALLGSYLTLNENTPCIFMHFLLTLLHS